MIINFLFGGIIFSLIEYIVNKLENPGLGSIISMIPIGYLTTYLIKKRSVVKIYVKNIIFVVCVTLIITTLFYFSLEYINLPNKILISIILIIWIFAQYLNYKLNISKYN